MHITTETGEMLGEEWLGGRKASEVVISPSRRMLGSWLADW